MFHAKPGLPTLAKLKASGTSPQHTHTHAHYCVGPCTVPGTSLVLFIFILFSLIFLLHSILLLGGLGRWGGRRQGEWSFLFIVSIFFLSLFSAFISGTRGFAEDREMGGNSGHVQSCVVAV